MQDATFWDHAAPRYARSPVKNIPAYEATLARVIGHLKDTDRVLETGCGTGSTALKLAGHVARYTATDVSAGMIDIAREKAAAACTPNLDFVVAGADADMFAPETFDAVLGFNLLHLVRDLDGTIARAHSLLKPGGLYITKSGCLGDMSVLIRMIIPLMRAIGKAPYVSTFRRAELEDSIRNGGFEIVDSTVFDGARNSRFVVARKV